MKKSILFILIITVIGLCSCNQDKAPVELTDSDMVYVDTVYRNMDGWDVSVTDSAQSFTIDKVAFFDFDGTNNICFYTLYPVTDVYGRGFFVNSDGMTQMKFSVYDT